MSTFSFCGLDWNKKDGEARGPGPNNWDRANVSLDNQGRAVLKITKEDEKWFCAEMSTTILLSYGTFAFNVNGQIDKFDQNVVLGMFCYGDSDGADEIDIEVARFEASKQLYYGVYPAKGESSCQHKTKGFELNLPGGTYSQHLFDWQEDSIVFNSDYGHPPINAGRIATWRAFANTKHCIPKTPLRLHINLWLRNGRAPSDGKNVEVTINSVQYPAVTT